MTSDRPDAELQPFRIEVPQADLDDLHQRLARTRWPDELPGAGWRYGPPVAYLKELADYWRSGYDWRAHEARLNRFPQFTTTINGANVHFVHMRSPEPGALPLLVTHGWPGSIAELINVLEPLADPVPTMVTRPTHSMWWPRLSRASGSPGRPARPAGTCGASARRGPR